MRMVREDVLNRILDYLTKGEDASFTGAALSRNTNLYDAALCRMGRRVTKTTTQPDTNTTRAETFVYDGYLQVANQSTISNQTTQQFYIWDPTEPVATRPLVWNREGNETAFYLHDDNKNVSEVVSASGEILAHYTYAPFGDCTDFGFSALSNPWRFSSEYADDEIGCVYYNYREYEPTTGRWFVFDLFEENGGVNLLEFCDNNPVALTDYNGYIPLDTVWDIANVIYDICIGDKVALAADTAALFVPYVPAGVSKFVKAARLSKVEKICPCVKKLEVTYEYLPAMLYKGGRHTLPRSAVANSRWIKLTERGPSKFMPGWTDLEIKGLIEEAFSAAKQQSKIKPNELDGFIYDAGRIVGASGGKLTKRIKIHINDDGRNLHAFPVP